MLSPDFAAIFYADANEIAMTAHGVDTIAIHRGRTARTIAPLVLQQAADFGRPNLLAAIGIKRDELLLVVPRADREKLPIGDGITRKANAGILEQPNPLGSAGRPLLEQSGLLGNVGMIDSAPTGPVIGSRGLETEGNRRCGGQNGEGSFCHDLNEIDCRGVETIRLRGSKANSTLFVIRKKPVSRRIWNVQFRHGSVE